MFKIAINAGHGLYTSGKRCLKSIDPNETREWQLNSRIVSKVIERLQSYEGYELLRIDDPTGQRDVPLKERTDKANKWGADFYLAIHHNAGIAGGSGGGIMAFTYLDNKIDQNTRDWQTALYNALIAHTGLKGNRSNPIAHSNLHEVRETRMAAVLIENGFMDSTSDTPIILSDDFANKSADAIVEVLAARGGLKKKTEQPVVTPQPTPEPQPARIDVTYQVWDDVHNAWLPNVKNTEDYAGIFGHDVCAVYANLSQGNIYYAVHTKGGKWLPVVANRNDYAGIFNRPIDGLMMRTDTGRTIRYRVHLRRKGTWLPWVTGYNPNDSNNGYAGIFGQEIDAIQISID